MRQTNADLRRYYRVANAKYFAGRLPKDMPVLFSRLKGRTGLTYVYKDTTPLSILVNEDLRTYQAITILTVIHEMVHVEHPQWKGHGWQFDRRMLRLAKDRAFCGLW